jgi:hypothetical protein
LCILKALLQRGARGRVRHSQVAPPATFLCWIATK